MSAAITVIFAEGSVEVVLSWICGGGGHGGRGGDGEGDLSEDFFFVIYFSPTGSGLKLLSQTLLGSVFAASTRSRSPFIHQPVAFGRLEAAAPLEP